MHRSKLFRALVIGGSMTAATLVGCGEEPNQNPSEDVVQNDSTSTDDTDSNASTEVEPGNEVDPETDTETETNTDTNTNTETDTETDTNTETDPSSSEEETSEADAELAPCFCNSEPSCCEEVDGAQQVVEGFECCWGTSC